jgi:hypothetical protein
MNLIRGPNDAVSGRPTGSPIRVPDGTRPQSRRGFPHHRSPGENIPLFVEAYGQSLDGLPPASHMAPGFFMAPAAVMRAAVSSATAAGRVGTERRGIEALYCAAPPTKPAIAYASCQSKPTCPNSTAPLIWLLAML